MTAKDVDQVVSEWAADPTRNLRMGDWRRVGYRRGASVPAAAGAVVRAAERGIVSGSTEDAAPGLQSLLDEIGTAGGGILELDAGEYRLDAPLFVRYSHVVLRGAGMQATSLHFSRPLEKSLGVHRFPGDDVSSGWSWSGGQIFVVAPERIALSQQAGWGTTEGWLPGVELAQLAPAQRGDYEVRVSDASRLQEGGMVLLEIDNDSRHTLLKHIAGDVEGALTYDWEGRAPVLAGPEKFVDHTSWRWPVKVKRIDGDTVILEQPLKFDIDAGLSARLRELGPTVCESGVEDLTIENALLEQTTHNLNPGSNGVCFQGVYDCWARNIHVINADLAFSLTAAKSCTLGGTAPALLDS